MDEPSKYNIDSKGYSKNASFWAFTLSIFIHACVIYFFDLSPSSFLKTTKCWFFIFNTIVFIVAADFGSFFSSRYHSTILEEYMENDTRIHNFPSLDLQDSVYHIPQENEKILYGQCQEKVIQEVVLSNKEILETGLILEGIIRDQNNHSNDMFCGSPLQIHKYQAQNEIRRNRGSIEVHHVNLCNTSEIVVYDENMTTIPTQELEATPLCKKVEEEDNDNDHEEEDEFSRMSNEEVNRRFEEFIHRCNQQIRLQ